MKGCPKMRYLLSRDARVRWLLVWSRLDGESFIFNRRSVKNLWIGWASFLRQLPRLNASLGARGRRVRKLFQHWRVCPPQDSSKRTLSILQKYLDSWGLNHINSKIISFFYFGLVCSSHYLTLGIRTSDNFSSHYRIRAWDNVILVCMNIQFSFTHRTLADRLQYSPSIT